MARWRILEIAGIDHIVLRTARREEMLHFYCAVLGCELERETPANTGLTQLRAGNALIDIVDVDSELGRRGGGPPSDTENNMDHFCLQLKSVAEEVLLRHLADHGVAAGEFELRYGADGFGRSLYIEDPDGNTVELRPLRRGGVE